MKSPPSREPSTILVVGVGNELRGDDAAGLLVVRKLRKLNLPNVRVIESSGDGAQLINAWTGFNVVFVVDAIIAAGNAGKVHRFEGHRQSLPTDFFGLSTHSFGLADAIELSRRLGCLPRELMVYGIEGKSFGIGQEISAAVIAFVQSVSEILKIEIQKCLAKRV